MSDGIEIAGIVVSVLLAALTGVATLLIWYVRWMIGRHEELVARVTVNELRLATQDVPALEQAQVAIAARVAVHDIRLERVDVTLASTSKTVEKLGRRSHRHSGHLVRLQAHTGVEPPEDDDAAE